MVTDAAWIMIFLRIPGALEEKFTSSGCPDSETNFSKLVTEVQQWDQRWGELLSGAAAVSNSQSPNRATVTNSRVVATPDFTETDCPIDATAAFQFEESDITPASAHMEFLDAITWFKEIVLLCNLC